jgi:diguanylate cyclase
MEKIPEPLIFEQDSPDQTTEILRMALASLNQNQLPISPLNYALAYAYFAGKSQPLNEKLNAYLEQGNELNLEDSKQLFSRFLFQCAHNVNEGVQEELIKVVAQIFGVLTEIAGKTALSNESLKLHINHLASSKSQKDIMSTAVNILEDTRILVKEVSNFESDIGSFSDEVKKLKSELSQAKQEALKDGLTGINNRRAFDLEIEKLIQDRRENYSQFSLIIADIDYFKKVNDTYGHIIGDKVLYAFAQVMASKTRQDDFPARFGGEEFAILLPNTNNNQAVAVAEHIRKTVESLRLKNTKTGKQLGQITVSLGVTCYRQGEQAQQIIERCDRALYAAKDQGRNRVMNYD